MQQALVWIGWKPTEANWSRLEVRNLLGTASRSSYFIWYILCVMFILRCPESCAKIDFSFVNHVAKGRPNIRSWCPLKIFP